MNDFKQQYSYGKLNNAIVSISGINVNDIEKVNYGGFYDDLFDDSNDHVIENEQTYFEVDNNENLRVNPLLSKITFSF